MTVDSPYANKLIIFDPQGQTVLEHYKYGGAEPDRITGDGILHTVQTPFGVISGIICWDIEFQGTVTQAGRNDTDILFTPNMTFRETDPIFAYIAVMRAIENGVSVVHISDGGPSGTVIVEGCDIDLMNSTIDLDYIDPDTGEYYYRDPYGNDLDANDNRGINFYIMTTGTIIIQNNTVRAQSAGIVNEAVGGTGDIIVTGNDVYVENLGIPKPFLRGYELVAPPPYFGEIPFTRTVYIANNNIQVVGDPDEGFTAGMHIGTDVGTPDYTGTITIKNNTVVMQDGNGAMIFGAETGRDWMSVLNGATVRNNKIRGYAQYGMLSINGAQYCNIFGNELDTFEPDVAHIGFYGSGTHDNTVRGYSGVVIVTDGAYNNHITGYTPMSP